MKKKHKEKEVMHPMLHGHLSHEGLTEPKGSLAHAKKKKAKKKVVKHAAKHHEKKGK